MAHQRTWHLTQNYSASCYNVIWLQKLCCMEPSEKTASFFSCFFNNAEFHCIVTTLLLLLYFSICSSNPLVILFSLSLFALTTSYRAWVPQKGHLGGKKQQYQQHGHTICFSISSSTFVLCIHTLYYFFQLCFFFFLNDLPHENLCLLISNVIM